MSFEMNRDRTRQSEYKKLHIKEAKRRINNELYMAGMARALHSIIISCLTNVCSCFHYPIDVTFWIFIHHCRLEHFNSVTFHTEHNAKYDHETVVPIFDFVTHSHSIQIVYNLMRFGFYCCCDYCFYSCDERAQPGVSARQR